MKFEEIEVSLNNLISIESGRKIDFSPFTQALLLLLFSLALLYHKSKSSNVLRMSNIRLVGIITIAATTHIN